MGQTITKYDVCALAYRAYLKALTPIIIQSGFRKTGIFPLNTDILAPEQLHPCESFREKRPFEKLKAMKIGPDAVEKILKEKEEILQVTNDWDCSWTQKKKTANISKKPNASGKAITTDEFFDNLTGYIETKKTTAPKSTKKSNKKVTSMYSPKPSTSGLQSKTRDNDSDSLECDSAEEDDKCCVRGKLYPPREIESLKIVGWAQCEKCDHWVHGGDLHERARCEKAQFLPVSTLQASINLTL